MGLMCDENLARRLSNLERKFEEMLKIGPIVEVDYDAARVKVDLDGRNTGWLPFFSKRAGNNRDWDAPEIDEQVMVLSPSGNPANGVALPAIFYDKFTAPANSADITRKTFGDGLILSHDRVNHITRISALANDGTLVLEAKNLILRTGEHGFYQTDWFGYANRLTHKGGTDFETETWHMGAQFTPLPDQGFHPPMVQADEEVTT